MAALAMKPRRRRWLWGAGFVAGAGALAVGPGAPYLVDALADGQRVSRLGHVEINGVSGTWLGDLRAARVTLADGEGVWVEASDVSLRWRPGRLLGGAFRLDEGRAREIVLSRRPALLPPRQSKGGLDVSLGSISAGSIILAEPVVGVAATFNGELALEMRERQIRSFDLALRRTDAEVDVAIAHYKNEAQFVLEVDVRGERNGVLSHALGAPDLPVRARGAGQGDGLRGAATFEMIVGENEAVSGESDWTNGRWSARAEVHMGALAPLRSLARRIGGDIAINASGAHTGAFSAHAQSNFLALDLDGTSTRDQGVAADFVASTDRLSDIARESPISLGAARLEGELRRARGVWAIEAVLDTDEIEGLGQQGRLTGPVNASLSAERFALTGRLSARVGSPAVFANARLRTELTYDLAHRRFELDKAELHSDAIAVDARGWATRSDGEFSGDWRLIRIQDLAPPVASGSASGRWRSFVQPGPQRRTWTTAVEGAGENVVGAQPALAQMLGNAPSLDGRLLHENGGITVSHARINGAQMRAGATGRVVRGQAELAIEASVRGPLSFGEVNVAGAADVTGRLSGRVVRPALELRATTASLAIGDVVVAQPIASFDLAPGANGYAGHATLQGSTSGHVLTAAADMSADARGLSLSNLEAQWGGMLAQGAANLDSQGLSATLDVNGVLDDLMPGLRGRMAGQVSLAPNALSLEASLADAHLGPLRAREAHVYAEGTLEDVAARFDARGRLGEAPLAFSGQARVQSSDGGARVTISGNGALAGVEVATRSPMQVDISPHSSEMTADFSIADGALRGEWRERGRGLRAFARVADAPLAPLAAIWGERATGRIAGSASIAGSVAGLSGETDFALTGVRVASRQRGALDLRIRGMLDPTRLQASVDAASTDGLDAHFEADAPVVTSAAPIRVALTPDRRGRATWSVGGPAASLWAAARLSGQSLDGQLSGAGEISFGAGQINGDGHIEVVDGRFEDKLTGVALVDLDARVGLSQNGITIERFSANGLRGGRLTATGASTSADHGRITLVVDAARIVDRPDARARADGQLTLAWSESGSALTGALAISEAELDAAADPQAGIPTLDVTEVNRVDGDEEAASDALPRRNGSTTLDVRITAPGRVFTRGRGVNAEWALDLRLDGTAHNPRLYGEARAARGTLALSGQPFEIESARIFFNGDPLDAQIDMSAVRDTADLTARLRFTGTARDPEIVFSSDPPLPADEILPQVLFGRSVADLSAFEAAQLAASLAALSGRASLDLMDAARAAAGLDRLNVRQDEAGGFLVAGGVYLTRDVYVEVARTGLGQAQTRVEWTMRPRLLLVTSFLGAGDQRVSLRWRRESD